MKKTYLLTFGITFMLLPIPTHAWNPYKWHGEETGEMLRRMRQSASYKIVNYLQLIPEEASEKILAYVKYAVDQEKGKQTFRMWTNLHGKEIFMSYRYTEPTNPHRLTCTMIGVLLRHPIHDDVAWDHAQGIDEKTRLEIREAYNQLTKNNKKKWGLSYAALTGDIERVKNILHTSKSDGVIDLNIATLLGHTAVVKHILDQNLNTRSYHMYIAGTCYPNVTEIVEKAFEKALINKHSSTAKAFLSIVDKPWALEKAATYGCSSIVRDLVDTYDDKITQEDLDRALLIAVDQDHKQCAHLLLGLGSRIDYVHNDERVIKTAQKKSVWQTDIIWTRMDGTPLRHAAENGSIPMLRLLLSHGADPFVRDTDGRKPSNWALLAQKKEAYTLLSAVERTLLTQEVREITEIYDAKTARQKNSRKLFKAVMRGDANVLEDMLIQEAAEPNMHLQPCCKLALLAYVLAWNRENCITRLNLKGVTGNQSEIQATLVSSKASHDAHLHKRCRRMLRDNKEAMTYLMMHEH